MMNKEELAHSIIELRKLIPRDLGQALEQALSTLPAHSPKADIVRGLLGRLNEANMQKVRGIISTEDLNLEYSRIRDSLLQLVSGFRLEDFQEAGADGGRNAARSGHLLYSIPDAMPLMKESRCVVRLAFEEESIIRNIELTDEITLKAIRISEVMEVELVDDNAIPTFEIRTLSSGEQFVERGDYTEWIFKVKPLRAGSYPLVLRIAVLEVVQGKERRKDIVLEETVEILAEGEIEAEADESFKSSGIITAGANVPAESHDVDEGESLQFPDVFLPELPKKVHPETISPGQPLPPSPRSPGAPVKPLPLPGGGQSGKTRRMWTIRSLSIAASFLLIASVGLWFVGSGERAFDPDDAKIGTPNNPVPADETEGSLDQFAPDTLSRDTIIER